MATKMETILERAKFALTSIKTLGTDIPDFAWKRCKGIAIITVSETGFVFGSYAVGDGVVLKKNADGTWTPPMAVKFTGPSVGLLVGKQTKQIILLPMTDAGMTALASMDRVNLGVQIGLTAGPVGNEAQLGFTSGSEGSASVMYSYTFSDGVFANIG
jgi:lipid-binding SYLF domain-containing protein